MTSKTSVIKTFKLFGLDLRGDGATHLCELLEPLPRDEHKQWVEAIIEAVQRLPITSTQISKAVIHKAAQEVGNAENTNLGNLLQVIDIFKIPKLTYNVDKRKFVLEPPKTHSLHGQAADKAALFRDRYTVVYQRTMNYYLFQRPVIGDAEDSDTNYSLKKVEYLLGSSSRLDEVVILGLLTQLVEGKYHLEDDTGEVQIDLTDAKFHTGLFTHNCFVLVEGWYEENVLHADAVGMPAPEAAQDTRDRMGKTNINYFGGAGQRCAKDDARLMQLEQENTDAMFVVLSDVWLDKAKVMDKLRVLFMGYANFPPTAFIFCGNFFSTSHGSQQLGDAQKAFGALGSLIAGFPELVSHSKFIFVPGPNDPGPSGIFPRPPLPRCMTEPLRRVVPSACFTSNPCRLLYCTQEVVVFREDIMAKMCRNCVHFPSDGNDIANHFAKTVVNQGHLTPLPLQVVPIYWPLDHCLALHPTPDLIITADKGDSFTTTHNGATVINPGSFSKTDYSFKVYLPATQQVEDSQIGEEDS